MIILGPIKLWVQKILGLKRTLDGGNILGQKKILGLKKFGTKEVWSKRILVQKKFGPQEIRPPQNWVQKIWSKLRQ